MTQSPSPFFILGIGGHGRVVASIAAALGREIAGFLDGRSVPSHDPIYGITVLGHYQKLANFPAPQVIVAIGDNAARARLTEDLLHVQPSAMLASLVHPRASIELRASFGEGSVICAGAVLCACASAGRGLILNTLASVDHDCVLGDFVHISPGAHVAGGVKIGDGTWVGIGASVKEGITIGRNCVIGAGAAVIRDVPDNTTVVGVPAKPITCDPKLGRHQEP